MALAGLLVACGGGGGSSGGSAALTYAVGGAVKGLAGAGLVLQLNGGDDLALTTDGAFAFADPLASGTAYTVTVKTQPQQPDQACGVSHPHGQVLNAAIADVEVVCRTVGISVVAGQLGGPGSTDGVGTNSRFGFIAAVAVDAEGTLYVADPTNSAVRRIAPDGTVTTYAGRSGSPGLADGPLASARFMQPVAVASGPNGTLYVADAGSPRIRQISNGLVTTLAGSAGGGYLDGPVSAALFMMPAGLVADAAGNVYVADYGNQAIRMISAAGTVSTIAGGNGGGYADGIGTAAKFNGPIGIDRDANGNLYIADSGNNVIRRITPAGLVSTLAGIPDNQGSDDGPGASARFWSPQAVAVDRLGNVYVADTGNNEVRRIAADGTVTTPAGSRTMGFADGTGRAAGFWWPDGVAVDAAGIAYVADSYNNTVRRVTAGGEVTTIAGKARDLGFANGPAATTPLYWPTGVAEDANGTVYLVDNSVTVARIGADGMLQHYGGGPGFNWGQSIDVDASGQVYALSNLSCVLKFFSDGTFTPVAGSAFGAGGYQDGPGAQALFEQPQSLALAPGGVVYVADTGNHVIRKIDAQGMVSTLAGAAGIPGAVDGAGVAARFAYPYGVATDRTGNLYVADTGNQAIRKITPAGDVTTVAGFPGTPGTADGLRTEARFLYPVSLTVDDAGNVFVVDQWPLTFQYFGTRTYWQFRVRAITPQGLVKTVAGTLDAWGVKTGGLPGALAGSALGDSSGVPILHYFPAYIARVPGPTPSMLVGVQNESAVLQINLPMNF